MTRAKSPLTLHHIRLREGDLVYLAGKYPTIGGNRAIRDIISARVDELRRADAKADVKVDLEPADAPTGA